MTSKNVNISITISIELLKILQDGADILSYNFNKTHPPKGYITHDKNFSIDDFLRISITDKYNEVRKEKLLIDSSN